MLEKTLLEEGYPKEHMQVIPDEQEAIAAALSMAHRDDLLLVFADSISRSWKQIIYYKPDGDEARSRRPASSPPPPKEPSSPSVSRLRAQEAFSGETVIQDERGVRLARETDD